MNDNGPLLDYTGASYGLNMPAPLLAAQCSSVASIAETTFEQHRILDLERRSIKNFASLLVQIQLMNTRPGKTFCPQKLVCLQIALFFVNTF